VSVSVSLCCVILCVGRGLASGRSPVQGVLPIVYRFIHKNPSTPQGKRGRLRKKAKYISNEVTNSMELNLYLEATNHSASQEIPRLLWNPKVYCCFRKSPLPEPDASSPHIPTLLPRDPF
jgi:hypothetical protein